MPEEGVCRRSGEAGAGPGGTDRPRRISHLVEFLREEMALRFADHIGAKNYAVQGVAVEEGYWRVRFFRYDPLCDIDAVTLDLLRDARDFGGSYEGWSRSRASRARASPAALRL
ncbi:MAG: ribonuclease E inhibitor RraB [Sphingomonadales bacterium]|nr:ribonuclease E inhibitor RraB [Sphingomonadales bacterium]